MVCLECGYLPRASVREAINATEDAPAETYQVPAVDPETGDGWDVEVEAESLRDAMQKASNPPDAHVASSFVQKHLEIGGRKLPARVVNEQLRSSTSAHPGVLRIGHEDGNQTAQC
ncbi:hypothetical protein GCM10008985_15770 [Halococcus dombrowskii]